MGMGLSVRRLCALGIAAATLAACATASQPQPEDDPVVWGRVDCKRAADHPELKPEYEQALAICENRAIAAGTAGTANMPGGYGMAGAISAGINQGIAEGNIRRSTTISCMAERGYLLKKKSEHTAACAEAKPLPASPKAKSGA